MTSSKWRPRNKAGPFSGHDPPYQIGSTTLQNNAPEKTCDSDIKWRS